MNKNFLFNTTFYFRAFIITVWFSLVVGFLYVPHLYDYFFHNTNVLHVVSFTNLITSEALDRFTEQTGIKVRLTHVDNDDELLAKLTLDKRHGYDMVIAFDYTIETLKKENLLQPIEKELIPNYDNGNEYSVPYSWLLYGIGYNNNYFPSVPDSWDMVFKNPAVSNNDYKICMLNEMRETIFLAALYLFNKTGDLSEQEIDTIEKKLIEQKKWVETYASDKLDYLLIANIVPIAITPSSYMMRVFKEREEFSFVVPSSGSIMAIENCAIPISSPKRDNVHKFINFLLSDEISALNCNEYGLYPVTRTASRFLDSRLFGKLGFPPSQDIIQRSSIIKNNISLKRLEDLWIAIKAS
jgi:spermidine/putrescine-binding protein